MSKDQSTQPVAIDPERMIERVYEHKGSPDRQSQDDFEQYLVERMYGADSDTADKFQPGTGGTISETERDGWIISPRSALVATVISSLALSLAGAKAPILNDLANKYIVDPAGDLIDKISPKYKPGGKQDKSVLITYKDTVRISSPGREQQSGQAEDDVVTTRELVKRMAEIQADQDQTLNNITLLGIASDEWVEKGDSSLGVPDSENADLSIRRANAARNSILAAAEEQGVDIPKINIEQQEKVLGPEGLGQLLTLANRGGYSSIGEAIRAYNENEKMPVRLESVIKEYIGQNRAITATLDYSKTGSVENPAKQTELEAIDENHEIPFGFIPIPPIPRFRRSQSNIFDEPAVLPSEPPEKAWIELYPEAMKRNGELVADSWSLTRKYQALLREERVKTLAQFEYRDEDHDPQAFKVAFVDHEPTEATIDAMSELLQVISKMNRGKVPERLNMIAVYPTSQTGPQHPKKIGLGIDEQYPSSTQGVAIPALSLVELHMPTNPTDKEINQFSGMKWIMAHEIAGHFTDVKEKPVKLTKASSYKRDSRNYHSSNPWVDTTPGDFGIVGEWGAVPVESRQFSIPSRREDSTSARTDEYVVGPGSSELAEAGFVRLSGIAPTEYGGKNPRETQAETAAQATTEILIPFEETGISGADKKAEGYAADAGLLFSFARRVGSKLNVDHLQWSKEQVDRVRSTWSNWLGRVQGDKNQRKISEKAKHTPYKPAKKRLRILADQKD